MAAMANEVTGGTKDNDKDKARRSETGGDKGTIFEVNVWYSDSQA